MKATDRAVAQALMRYIRGMPAYSKRMLAMVVLTTTGCAFQPVSYHPPAEWAAPAQHDRVGREIVAEAMSLRGVPYHYGGRSPETGFDCSGLVFHVVRTVTGVALPHDAYDMASVGTHVAARNLRPGDLVFFDTLHRPFSHVGIYVGKHRFVHAPSRGGVVEVADLNAPYWRRRYEGARRLSFDASPPLRPATASAD